MFLHRPGGLDHLHKQVGFLMSPQGGGQSFEAIRRMTWDEFNYATFAIGKYHEHIRPKEK